MKLDSSTAAVLSKHNLRDTQTRRLVLQALGNSCTPLSPGDVRTAIVKKGNTINIVTVYRILETFVQAGIVHRHPYNALFSLCSLPDTPGHHGFLHCTDCGKVEEFCNHQLCKIEDAIAKQSGYRPGAHISEIHGTCHSCQSR